MAYIQPDATILICKGIPLNSTYDDTMTFYDNSGKWNFTKQYEYFSSKTSNVITKEHYSVVRERQGVLRVEGDVSLWQDVNYMVFTNKNFGGKHFYAFINQAEYVNPNTTFLYFQIDVMQTWLGDMEFETCLIDREHVKDDSYYANLESEDIEVSERISFSQPFNLNNYLGTKILVMGFTEDPGNFATYNSVIPYDPALKAPNIDWLGTTENYYILNISDDLVSYNYATKQFEIDESTDESISIFNFSLNAVRSEKIASKYYTQRWNYKVVARYNTELETPNWEFTATLIDTDNQIYDA